MVNPEAECRRLNRGGGTMGSRIMIVAFWGGRCLPKQKISKKRARVAGSLAAVANAASQAILPCSPAGFREKVRYCGLEHFMRSPQHLLNLGSGYETLVREGTMIDDDHPKTTTILTIELPPDLGERLRDAMRRKGRRSLRRITLEALEAWLEQDEQAGGT